MSRRFEITVFRNYSGSGSARPPLTLWARIRLFCWAVAGLAVIAVIFVVAVIVGSVIAAAVLAVLAVLVASAILKKRNILAFRINGPRDR